MTPDYASRWLEALKSTATADRRWKQAVKALSSMGLWVAPALIDATGDDHPEVRRGAAQALQKIGAPIIPFWIKALKHEKSSVREAAARGLYGLAAKAQKAIPALTDAMRDSDAFVRQWVATALEKLAQSFGPILKVAVTGLVELLKDADFMVREWAAHALGSIGLAAESALPALEMAQQDEESSVKEAAAQAVKQIQKAQQ
jgi:HEAT repeat protein